MSAIDRHEQTRADWVLAHEAKWHLSDRRMANDLKARAARKNRSATGAAESSHHEGRIAWIGSRFVSRGDDPTEKMLRGVFLAAVLVPGIAFWFGPALVASFALYAAVTTLSLRLGRTPRALPWLALTALALLGGIVVPFSGLVSGSMYPSITLHVAWDRVGLVYFWLQLVAAPALTAWHLRRHGWPGVRSQRQAKLPTMPGVQAVPGTPAVPEVPVVAAPATQPEEAGLREAEQEPHREGDAEQPKEPVVPAVPTVPAVPQAEGVEDEPESEDEPVFDDEPEPEFYEDWMDEDTAKRAG